MISIVEQLEAYRKNHVMPQTIDNLSPHGKKHPGSAEREERRVKIYEAMSDKEIWTTKELSTIFGWDVRQISSAMKVLVDNGFVKVVGHIRVNTCKTCLYKRIK